MRGLDKPSTNTTEQQKSLHNETIPLAQEKVLDENGMTFLV